MKATKQYYVTSLPSNPSPGDKVLLCVEGVNSGLS